MNAMDGRPPPAVRLLRLSRSNQLILVEAFLILASASLAIKLVPFRRTVAMVSTRPRQGGHSAPERDRIIAQCRWAVVALARRVPWRAVCFQRGLALHLMLRRRGIDSVLHYGVDQSEGHGLRAHVWISAGGRIVLGGEEAPQFACLASFPSPDAA